jgi:hypothetical protein
LYTIFICRNYIDYYLLQFKMRIGIACCLFILSGCVNPRISTNWKIEPVLHERYYRILVVAVVPEADSVLRKTIETEAVNSLSGYGYYAVSAVSTFGRRGLAAATQEETYLKLCNYGIDAVITFALVPEKENIYAGTGQYLHPNSYYYNRIWNYKKMQSAPDFVRKGNKYCWETIMFDLFTLQAIGIIRTRFFVNYQHSEITNDVASLVLNRMLKEKIIQQRKVPLKPF